jgi:hypothetical protein
MGTQFAVLHIQKISGSAYALGLHNDREKLDKNYSIKENIDEEKTRLNYSNEKFKGEKNLDKAIAQNIAKNKTSKRKIGKNQVKAFSVVLSGSHERMKELEKQKGKENELAKWCKENIKFLQEEFGAKNIVKFWVHRDEKTPHIHAILTPITKDGRLNAKEILGNKKTFEERQTRYAEKMAQFGLERGVEKTITQAHHIDINDWYREQYKAKQLLEQTQKELSYFEEEIKQKTLLEKASDVFGDKKKIRELKKDLENEKLGTNKLISQYNNLAERYNKQNDEYRAYISKYEQLSYEYEQSKKRIDKLEAEIREKEKKELEKKISAVNQARNQSVEGQKTMLKAINDFISKHLNTEKRFSVRDGKIKFSEPQRNKNRDFEI